MADGTFYQPGHCQRHEQSGRFGLRHLEHGQEGGRAPFCRIRQITIFTPIQQIINHFGVRSSIKLPEERFYPRATSRIIMMVKPNITPKVASWVLPPLCASGAGLRPRQRSWPLQQSQRVGQERAHQQDGSCPQHAGDRFYHPRKLSIPEAFPGGDVLTAERHGDGKAFGKVLDANTQCKPSLRTALPRQPRRHGTEGNAYRQPFREVVQRDGQDNSVVRFQCDFNPSGAAMLRCRWGSRRSTRRRKVPPSRKPTAAGTQAGTGPPWPSRWGARSDQ